MDHHPIVLEKRVESLAIGGHEIGVAGEDGRILERILEQTPRPTAVFALADVIAYGIIEAATAHGLRVPEDLAVVGFDDLEASSLIAPALTTVRQPIAEKGRKAAEILMTMLQGNKRCDHVVLPVDPG